LICGIIDLGSNTIRLSIYQCENMAARLLLNKKITAGLSGYVEGGELSLKGINKACSVLSDFENILSNFNIQNAHVFATASLRNIGNTEEAVSIIRDKTGFSVDVLSGEEEARLDYVGAAHAVSLEKGLLVDIGGGSTELVTFQNEEILKAVSMPVGCLNLFLKHVPFLLPTSGSIKEMKRNILAELKKADFFEEKKQSVICGVGGTIRAAGKLYNDIYELSGENMVMESDKLGKMLALYKNNGKDILHRILQIAPERIHTILPGMMILNAIAKSSKSREIVISGCGVREGYLYGRVLNA